MTKPTVSLEEAARQLRIRYRDKKWCIGVRVQGTNIVVEGTKLPDQDAFTTWFWHPVVYIVPEGGPLVKVPKKTTKKPKLRVVK
jgi:uncharacterized protein YegL